jgi:hypothetical protein
VTTIRQTVLQEESPVGSREMVVAALLAAESAAKALESLTAALLSLSAVLGDQKQVTDSEAVVQADELCRHVNRIDTTTMGGYSFYCNDCETSVQVCDAP